MYIKYNKNILKIFLQYLSVKIRFLKIIIFGQYKYGVQTLFIL